MEFVSVVFVMLVMVCEIVCCVCVCVLVLDDDVVELVLFVFSLVMKDEMLLMMLSMVDVLNCLR